MDNNISQSNARLRQVSKPISETKTNVQTSNKIASSTASSKDHGISTLGSENQNFKKTTNNFLKGSTKIRASHEGYMYAPSAHIQVNNYGYDNKIHQKARVENLTRKPTVHQFAQTNLNLPSGLSKSGIINNYTKCSLTNTSKSIMDKKLKLNKLF